MAENTESECFSRRDRDRGCRVKNEFIHKLRLDEEIAHIQGKEYFRQLPPPPVLPPVGPLTKISGRLEQFSKEGFREYFDVDAYRTSSLPEITDGQRGAGAVLATVAGSPATGAALMTASDSEYSNAEYVQGVINGKPFRGWVGMTRLQAGDNVEMAAVWQNDHYEVYAITLPEERIISLCPRCEMGHMAHAWWRIKNMFILTACLLVMAGLAGLIGGIGLVGLAGVVDALVNIVVEINLYVKFTMIMTSAFLGLSALMALSAYKSYTPTVCNLAEEIYRVLGMEKAPQVDLRKITKQREKELMAEGKWYSPILKSKALCPTRKYFTLENWYYY